MGRITDRKFVLPEIAAMSVRKQFQNSQNKPLLIQGVDKQTGKSGFFVLKPTVGLRMSWWGLNERTPCSTYCNGVGNTCSGTCYN